jgi:DNA helicase-2/ATP-dependent DNA helicase PcrA
MVKKEYIIAPAGHGKTEQIADLVIEAADEKKILVLTHTNAGISSLMKRFKKKKIKSDKYDIKTIDSLALTYSMAYPGTSEVKKVPTSSMEYEICRKGAIKVFSMSFLKSFVKERYSLLIVDEYQDCSKSQHEFIMKIAENIHCIVLGDPLQGIFSFGSCDIVNWNNIRMDFEVHPKKLLIPHRWNNGAEELGKWIKETREKIINGEEILFNNPHIKVIKEENQNTKIKLIFKILDDYEEVLIIIKDESLGGSLKKSIAEKFKGRLQIIDSLEFKPLFEFLKGLYSNDKMEVFNSIIKFCKICMTRTSHFDSLITRKVKKIWEDSKLISELRGERIRTRGDSEEVRGKQVNELYLIFLDVLEKTGVERAKLAILLMEKIQRILKEYSPQDKGYIYRRDTWDSAKNSLNSYVTQNGKLDLVEYGRKMRHGKSFVGKGFSKVIGTTLLTKGLEFEHVIIDSPENMEAKHLYVALSRARKKITILSQIEKFKVEKPTNI